jgi:hypothetical protein
MDVLQEHKEHPCLKTHRKDVRLVLQILCRQRAVKSVDFYCFKNTSHFSEVKMSL